MKKLLLLGALCSAVTVVSTEAAALGGSTYTYLRCFYRVSDTPKTPATSYHWGLDPTTGGWYHVKGNWWKDGPTSWMNMFYTNTSQATLKSVCASTLTKKGIKSQVAAFTGADNSLSLNYTIYTNDSTTQTGKINKIITVGDSLSDNQNLYNATQWKVPNPKSWFVGRFSNHKVWEEYMAESLGLPMYNWAVAGAAADSYYVIPGVNQQVDSVLIYLKDAPNYKWANSLFTVLIGGNDLVNYDRTPESIIAKEQEGIEKLIVAGAKNILMLNVPELSKAPVFAMRPAEDAVKVKANVADLNARLVVLRDAMQAKYGTSLNIKLFDTMSVMNDMLANPAAYGITNTTQSCLDINEIASTTYAYQQGLRANCTDPNTFVFWDTLHPTTNTHRIIAEKVTAFVRANFTAVP